MKMKLKGNIVYHSLTFQKNVYQNYFVHKMGTRRTVPYNFHYKPNIHSIIIKLEEVIMWKELYFM